MLGSSLVESLRNKYDVTGYDKKSFDVTDRKCVNEIINSKGPDIIIHTAANTDAEFCERNPEEAYLVNTTGTDNIVNCLLENNNDALLVYISSTGVYGESKNDPYTEYDLVNPTTIHHKSKYSGEQSVFRLNKYLVIRTGWLFGGSINHKKNFVYNRYLEAVDKDYIYSDFQQKGNPTSINDLCTQIEYLLQKKMYGLFNAVGNRVATRYDYIKEIISCFGLPCIVKKTSHKNFQRIAPVSLNESAINHKLKLFEIDLMRPWKKSLLEYISTIKIKE